MNSSLRRCLGALVLVACLSAPATAIAPDPVRACKDSGGTWTDCGSGCGPLTCANPTQDPDMDCPSVCTEMCECPPDAPLWEQAMGCIAEVDCIGAGDPAPPGMDLCDDTGGTWDWCGSGCGPMGCGDDPEDFESCPKVCVEQCACPEDSPLWDESDGCISPSDCVDSPQKTLCDATGGDWQECGSGCGPRTCDEPTLAADVDCPAMCVEQCGCPESAPLWHETLGCIAATACEGASVDTLISPALLI